MELRQRAFSAFCKSNPLEKAQATQALWDDLAALAVDNSAVLTPPDQPGRPALPALVHPQEVPRRSPFTALGHAALIHSIAHIEFNAMK